MTLANILIAGGPAKEAQKCASEHKITELAFDH